MIDTLLMYSAQVILGVVFGGVAVVLALESFVPFRPLSDGMVGRWVNNLAMTLFDYGLLLFLSPGLVLLVSDLVPQAEQGLIERLGFGAPGAFVVTLLLLELFGYWLHRAFHVLPWLWRIHAVHHSDIEVDATTAHRHHPLEPLISTVITLPVVLVLGIEPIILLAYNVLRLVVAVISHGNLSLPPAIEKALRSVLVTPDFHRMHHSAERRYTDSNYSTILPLYDYLFRTASHMERDQQRTMTLGLERFRDARDSRVDQLLAMPFKPGFDHPRA